MQSKMKKTIICLFTLLLASTAFVACDDPYANQFVAEPTINEQGPVQSADGFTISLGSAFGSAVVLTNEDLESSKILEAVKATATPQLPEGAYLKYKIEASDTKEFTKVVQLSSVSANNAASVSAVDLNEAVKTLFGKAPNARQLFLRVSQFW